jgi:hypothetical protein
LALVGLGGSVACVPLADGPAGPIGAEVPEVEATSPSDDLFEASAARWDVPADVLRSLAWAETRFVAARGEVEHDGRPAPWGIFALRGAILEAAAAQASLPVDVVKTSEAAQIEAAAARLAALAEQEGLPDGGRADPLAWTPVVARFSGIEDEEMAESFAADVERVLRTGLIIPLEDGTSLVIDRHDPGAASRPEDANVAVGTSGQGLRAPGAAWRPSPNHNSRRGRRPELVVIHTCEGSYAGCVSWLRQRRSRVSAHYVVKEDGREISQLVDENRRAWHVGASYRSRLNGGRLAHRDGVSVNSLSIGVEHGGFARTRRFDPDMIEASAQLVRGITERHGIPRDRYHIVAHGRLQPETRTDPGPNWPWATYIARIAAGSSAPPSNPPPSNPPPSSPPPSNPSAGRVVTVDNPDDGFEASRSWAPSSWAAGKVGRDYRFRAPAFVSDPAKYRARLPRGGRYEVFARVPGHGYNTKVPYLVFHRGGRTIVERNQRAAGASWMSLGTYAFAAGDLERVWVSCWTNGRGWIVADAVRFVAR